jgi:hypothetical protein
MQMFENELKTAIGLIKQGEKRKAFQILSYITTNDPDNESAWLWMTTCVNSAEDQIICLEKVLSINPNNIQAKNYYQRLVNERREEPWNFPEPKTNLEKKEDGKQLSGKPGKTWGLAAVLIIVIGICMTAILIGVNISSSQRAQDLQSENTQLQKEISAERNTNFSLRSEFDDLKKKYDDLNKWAVVPPYILTKQRNITVAFNKLDGSIDSWDLPFDTFEKELERGNIARSIVSQPSNFQHLYSDNGKDFYTEDMTLFVDPTSFEKVVPDLYYESGNNEEKFIKEVWNFVTQLSIYSNEIGEIPRFPLETLNAGGGDCEDTAILFASMILAAPVDWKVQLVYMDIDNPTNPQKPNHVAVHIDTGTSVYLIETTSDIDMQPYSGGVKGWYYDVGD